MRYSIEPRHGIYVKGCGSLSFAKNMSSRYSQKLLDSAKKYTADAIKIASKRAIQKTAEVACNLINNKIADKLQILQTNLPRNYIQKKKKLIMKYQKKDIYLQKKDNKLLMN